MGFNVVKGLPKTDVLRVNIRTLEWKRYPLLSYLDGYSDSVIIEPVPRYAHNSASIGTDIYVWGGIYYDEYVYE